MLFGDVESTSKSAYSSDSKRLLSILSVNGAYYCKTHKKNNFSGISCAVKSKRMALHVGGGMVYASWLVTLVL